MTKIVSALLLLTLAATAATAATKRPAARKHHPSKAAASPAASKAPAVPTAPAAMSPSPDSPAAAAGSEVTLYDGKAAGPTTPSVAAWGGGSGQDSTETYLFGGHSLKVTTQDLYQGARITFPTPVSLGGDNRVFQMTLRRGGAVLHYDPRTTSALPPGEAPAGGQFSGRFGQFSGQNQGRNGRRNGRRRGRQQEAPAVIPPVTQLRLSFAFADGRQADILRPLPSASDALAGEGWYSVNVPVSALKLGGGADPLLKSVTVGGDHYGVFFVGRLKLGTDTPTLAITIDGPDSVLPGQPVTLTAKGGNAFSALKYTWDLDEGDQAGQFPGQGRFPGQGQLPGQFPGAAQPLTDAQATVRYFEAGQDHTVTLTVTDLDSLKTPVTVTKVIHVKEQGNGPGGSPGARPNFPGAGPGGFPQGNGLGAPPDGGQGE